MYPKSGVVTTASLVAAGWTGSALWLLLAVPVAILTIALAVRAARAGRGRS